MLQTSFRIQAFGTVPPKLKYKSRCLRDNKQSARVSSGFNYEEQVVVTPGEQLIQPSFYRMSGSLTPCRMIFDLKWILKLLSHS